MILYSTVGDNAPELAHTAAQSAHIRQLKVSESKRTEKMLEQRIKEIEWNSSSSCASVSTFLLTFIFAREEIRCWYPRSASIVSEASQRRWRKHCRARRTRGNFSMHRSSFGAPVWPKNLSYWNFPNNTFFPAEYFRLFALPNRFYGLLNWRAPNDYFFYFRISNLRSEGWTICPLFLFRIQFRASSAVAAPTLMAKAFATNSL